MKKILINVAVIAVAVALTATATWAYFGSVWDSTDATVTAATVSIGLEGTAGFPLSFVDLLPGAPASVQTIKVMNTSLVPVDFYMQLIGDAEGFNFCKDADNGYANYDPQYLYVKVEHSEGGNWVEKYWGPALNLYPGEATSKIPVIASNVAAETERTFQVSVWLTGGTPNKFQGKVNTDLVNLIAVQAGGTAPEPLVAGDELPASYPFLQAVPWPVGDTNYE